MNMDQIMQRFETSKLLYLRENQQQQQQDRATMDDPENLRRLNELVSDVLDQNIPTDHHRFLSSEYLSNIPLELFGPVRQFLQREPNRGLVKIFLDVTHYLTTETAISSSSSCFNKNAFCHFPDVASYNAILHVPILVKVHENYGNLSEQQKESLQGKPDSVPFYDGGLKILVLTNTHGAASAASNSFENFGREIFSDYRIKMRKIRDQTLRTAPPMTVALTGVPTVDALPSSTRTRLLNREIFCAITDVTSLRKLVADDKKNSRDFMYQPLIDFSKLEMILIAEGHGVLKNMENAAFIDTIVAPLSKKSQIVIASVTFSQQVQDFVSRFIPRSLNSFLRQQNSSSSPLTSSCVTRTFVASPPFAFMMKCYDVAVHDGDAEDDDFMLPSNTEQNRPHDQFVETRARTLRRLISKIKEQEHFYQSSRTGIEDFNTDDVVAAEGTPQRRRKYQIVVCTKTTRELSQKLIPLVKMLSPKLVGKFAWIDSGGGGSAIPSFTGQLPVSSSSNAETLAALSVPEKISLFQRGEIDILAFSDVSVAGIGKLIPSERSANEDILMNKKRIDPFYIFINYDDLLFGDQLSSRISTLCVSTSTRATEGARISSLLERVCVVNLQGSTENNNNNRGSNETENLDQQQQPHHQWAIAARSSFDIQSSVPELVSDWFPHW